MEVSTTATGSAAVSIAVASQNAARPTAPPRRRPRPRPRAPAFAAPLPLPSRPAAAPASRRLPAVPPHHHSLLCAPRRHRARVAVAAAQPAPSAAAAASAAPARLVVDLPTPLGLSLTERHDCVIVTAVRPDSPATGLVRVGDVVLTAAGRPATDVSAVVDAVRAAIAAAAEAATALLTEPPTAAGSAAGSTQPSGADAASPKPPSVRLELQRLPHPAPGAEADDNDLDQDLDEFESDSDADTDSESDDTENDAPTDGFASPHARTDAFTTPSSPGAAAKTSGQSVNNGAAAVSDPSERSAEQQRKKRQQEQRVDPELDAAVLAFSAARPENRESARAAVLKLARARLSTGRSAFLVRPVLARLRGAGVLPDARLWNAALTAFLRAGRPARAIALFADIERPSVECFTTVAASYARLRRPDDAIAILPAMRGRGLRPNIRTYNAIIAACSRAGRLDMARGLFTEMALIDDIRPNVVSWNIIINWHVETQTGARRLAGVLTAFEDMKASGVTPNVVSYTTVMKAYTRSGMLHRAEEVFAELKRVLPAAVDTEAYNTLLSAYSGRLEWRRTLELLEEMRAGDVQASEADQPRTGAAFVGDARVPAHSQSFSNRRPWLRSEDAENEDSDEAPSETATFTDTAENKTETSVVSDELTNDTTGNDADKEKRQYNGRRTILNRSIKPDAVSYALAVKACATAGRADRARIVFDEMLEAGFRPPPRQAVVSLLGGYARYGRLGDALDVLRALKEWGVTPEVRMLSTVMHACLEAGEPALALDVHKRVVAAGLPRDVVIGTLELRAHVALGNIDSAVAVLQGMQDAVANGSEKINGKAALASAPAPASASASNGNGVIAAIDHETSSGETTMAETSKRKGKTKNATAAAAAAAAVAAAAAKMSSGARKQTAGGGREAGAGQRASVVTYNTLIEGAVRHGRLDVATATLELLLRDRESQVNRATADALVGPLLEQVNSSSDAVCGATPQSSGSQLEFLLKAVDRLRLGGVRPNGRLYSGLLALCERCGQWSTGRELVAQREGGGFDVGRRDAKAVRALEDAVRAHAATTERPQ